MRAVIQNRRMAHGEGDFGESLRSSAARFGAATFRSGVEDASEDAPSDDESDQAGTSDRKRGVEERRNAPLCGAAVVGSARGRIPSADAAGVGARYLGGAVAAARRAANCRIRRGLVRRSKRRLASRPAGIGAVVATTVSRTGDVGSGTTVR